MPSENFAKIFSGRALNRPRESRGSQPSISLKHGRLAHVRSQFSLFRRSPTHKNLPLATFCTSERVFAVLFARRKKYQKPFPLQGVLRFCKPRISTQNNNFAQTKLKPFSALVSLKHGRLAHVRSQFSLFRRSPTHKNLPPATFCTSEQFFFYFL